jgi:uridine kinase
VTGGLSLHVLLRAVAAADRPVVLIDGGAGSGKSTLAAEIAEQWPTSLTPQVVCTDQFCPGWDGLAVAAARVPQVITTGEFVEWDWLADAPGEPRLLDPRRPLIVEGCGAITPASRELATLAIWLDAPEDLRRERALARDGEVFAPHWQQWAVQEQRHWQAGKPWELADLVIDVENDAD